MMDQQSTKSEADLMKRKNPTIQSRAIERDICDDLLYQQHNTLIIIQDKVVGTDVGYRGTQLPIEG